MRRMTFMHVAVWGALGLFAAGPLQGAIITRWDANNLAQSDGSSVGTWSSNVGSFTLSGTGTAQPTYQSTGLNGKPTVVYNGTSNVLATGAAVNNAKTVVAVGIAATGSPSLATLISNGSDSRDVRINNTTNFYRSEGNGGDNNDFYRIDGSVTGNDGVYVNDVLSGSFTYDVSHVVLSESDSANSYSNFWVGNASTSLARFWKGDVSEIIVFDNALTSDERTGVAHNLSVKWGFASPISANQSQIDAANALGVTAPEPASLSLLAVGALGLLTRGTRRRPSNACPRRRLPC